MNYPRYLPTSLSSYYLCYHAYKNTNNLLIIILSKTYFISLVNIS